MQSTNRQSSQPIYHQNKTRSSNQHQSTVNQSVIEIRQNQPYKHPLKCSLKELMTFYFIFTINFVLFNLLNKSNIIYFILSANLYKYVPNIPSSNNKHITSIILFYVRIFS